MAVAVWQQILALDARYNVQRALEDKPSFRTLYMRRRSQLLRENAKRHSDPTVRQDYLQIRKQLMQLKFDQLSDTGSDKARSGSRVSNLSVSDKDMKSRGVIPTEEASASRAMVGNTTIAENYAFAGVFHIFDQHKDPVTVVEFANDDKTLLACASMDCTVSICRLGDEEKAPNAIILRGHTKGVTCCEWSASNDWLVSVSIDGQMILWDAVQGLPLRVVSFGKEEELHSCAFAPTNNNFVIVGNNKGLLRTTNVSTGIIPSQLICNLGHKVQAVGFHPGGGLLWAGDDVGGITAFAFVPTTGQLSRKKRTVVRANVPVTGLQCRTWLSREACDPTLLVNCGQSIFVFRVANDDGILIPRCCFNSSPSPLRSRPKKELLTAKSCFGRLMSFRKGVPIVAGSLDGSIRFFDLLEPSKPAFNSLQGHSSPVLDVSFNSDESFLASGDASGSVIIWTRSRKET